MQVVELPHDGSVEIYDPQEGAGIIVEEALKSKVLCKGAKKNRRYYYDVIMSFDIETTKLENLNFDPKRDAMCFKYFNITFCWQCCVNGKFIFGRNVEDFFDMIDAAGKHLDGLIVCYIHNIAYEYGNLRDYFTEGVEDPERDIFFKTRSTPLYLRYRHTFEFRCSKLLTGKGLAGVGKDIKYKKLKGDFDYNIQRDVNTPIGPLELNYCYRDVFILYRYLLKEREDFCKTYRKKVTHIAHLPYTSTGYVRTDVQKEFSKTNHGRYILKQTELTEAEYDEISPALWGGYAHTNFRYIGEEIKNVWHDDICSAYPGAFFDEDGFPYKLTRSTLFDIDTMLVSLRDPARAVIAKVTFRNIILKKGGVPYIPFSKSLCSGEIVENGKVMWADSVTLVACDVDLKLIEAAYDFKWNDCSVEYFYVGMKQKMPYNVLRLIVKYFNAKTALKGVKGADAELEYGMSKRKINAIYGLICQALKHTLFKLVDGECVEFGTEYKAAETLPYQWAIYITAYTRRLIYSIIQIAQRKNSFIYSDTDSLFYKYDPDVIAAVQEHNRKQMARLRELSKWFYGMVPKNPKGEEQFLFTLQHEDCTDDQTEIKQFCAIGAKRYYQGKGDGLYNVTFSGLRATKIEEIKDPDTGEVVGYKNGYNTQRLIDMFGNLNKAFKKIKDDVVELPYVEDVDKLSNYNITADFKGELNGVKYFRPCSYTLYPVSMRLSLNRDLYAFLNNYEIADM